MFFTQLSLTIISKNVTMGIGETNEKTKKRNKKKIL